MVDFDGVIHRYSEGWKDGSIYDHPVDGALESIGRLRAAGFEVVIFTTRASTAIGALQVYTWLEQHGLPDVDNILVTDSKLGAIAYIDDRGIRFTNWADMEKYFL